MTKFKVGDSVMVGDKTFTLAIDCEGHGWWLDMGDGTLLHYYEECFVKVEPKKRWIPKEGEKFWVINFENLKVVYEFNYNYTKSYLSFNCFRTKREAQAALKQIKLILKND